MRLARIAFTALVACWLSTPTLGSDALNLIQEANTATKACLTAVEQQVANTSALSNHGYVKRGNKYRKSPHKTVLLNSKSSVSVESRTTRKFTSCSITFSLVPKSTGQSLQRAVQSTIQRQGYAPVVFKDKKGRSKNGFRQGNVVLTMGGSTSYSHSTYSVSVWLQRDK